MAGSSGKAPWRKRVLSTSWAQWQGEESGGWGTEWRLGEGPHQGKQQVPLIELQGGQAPQHTGISSFILHHGPEEDQAQRGCVTCPRSPSQEVAEPAPIPGLLLPQL